MIMILMKIIMITNNDNNNNNDNSNDNNDNTDIKGNNDYNNNDNNNHDHHMIITRMVMENSRETRNSGKTGQCTKIRGDRKFWKSRAMKKNNGERNFIKNVKQSG